MVSNEATYSSVISSGVRAMPLGSWATARCRASSCVWSAGVAGRMVMGDGFNAQF